MPSKKVLIFENTHQLTNYLISRWPKIVADSVKLSGKFTMALSGGKTPIEFYSRLSNLKDFDLWVNTYIFQTDERFVPFKDLKNNFHMIKETLINYVDLPSKHVHPINTDFGKVALSAEQYENELKGFFALKENELPIFDLILLGIGEDGHVASLFPDDKNINDANRLVIPVENKKIQPERISLTLPVINNAKEVIFLVTGSRKADIVRRMIEVDDYLPSSRVKLEKGELLFLLDKDAAINLTCLDNYSHEGEAICIHL